MKRIYKYATGDEVPPDAQYLLTIEHPTSKKYSLPEHYNLKDDEHWITWHYFLVEVKTEECKVCRDETKIGHTCC